MAQPLTRDDFRQGLRDTTRDIIDHFNKSQAAQNKQVEERFDRVERHLDAMSEDIAKIKLAVVDVMAADRHLHNLVAELKAKGLDIDEARVFAT